MSLLQYEHYKFQTKLGFDEIQQRLNKTIGQENAVNEYIFGSLPYYGKIVDRFFLARRIKPERLFSTGLANLSSVTIFGKIQTNIDGCLVELTISSNNTSKKSAFFSIVLISGFQLIILIFMVIRLFISHGSDGSVFLLIPIALLGLSYLISWVGFKLESITMRNDFFALFDVDIEV